MIRVAVLVSGGGTNLQALIDARDRWELGAGRLVAVIASSPKAYALERAARAGIDTEVIRPRSFDSPEAFDAALEAELLRRKIDLVVLAGYLAILGPRVLRSFEKRIINVHPSLIPAFCGEGFYGLQVHASALEYGVKVTGATVHYVNEVVDGGEIILQKAVPVLEGDTPEQLQRRVMEQAEWELLPKAVALVSEKIELERGTGNVEKESLDQRIR